ncbi:MAG: 30S ribosomal protein S19e [Candidatus Bathyarchaeota archaeon]|nr:30S ribosomal protein S19e [Candidatus Bathyarchaeota archaeon]MDH5747588.1 30S ribosomal protein S19e [Candidatus Bathyarchaeota archaeon]
MTTPHDVPASKLVEKLANYLKKNVDETNPPTWATIVKTGVHVQRPPQNPDWWYIRCASLLRKIYVHGPIGVEKLRAEYGGRKGYGVRPDHAAKASGAIIRKALQQLEAAGFVGTFQTSGRRVTKKGRKLLEELAEELKEELVGGIPELKKYQKGA